MSVSLRDHAPRASARASAVPPPPEALAETGLLAGLLIELLLKALYTRGALTATELVEIIGLPFAIVDEQMHEVQQRRLVEVVDGKGGGRKTYRYDLVQAGRERAREALAASEYVGRAPVPLAQYCAQVANQSSRGVKVSRSELREDLAQLILEPGVLEMLGPAINAGKAILLYGSSGNGKTLIAETLANALGGSIYVPHAVLIEGQIVSIFDPIHHHLVPDEQMLAGTEAPSWLASAGRIVEEKLPWFVPDVPYDRRFAHVRRPAVVTGSELTLEQLDLRRDPQSNLLQAPLQLRANGGVLVIDDLGRHRIPPRELLNRWLVPLEKRVDYLTLPTGGKVTVPFDCLVIFASDLALLDLADAAFLRRIPYKIFVGGPSRPAWEEILRRCCEAREIPYSSGAAAYVFAEYYQRRGITPSACHPRDLLDCIRAIASFLELEPTLSGELLERACATYFADVQRWEDARARSGAGRTTPITLETPPT